MVNNFIQVLLVPEIALAILTSICLLYGLFSKKNSYVRTTNLALISLMLIPFLVFFNPTTNFAYYNELFTNSSFSPLMATTIFRFDALYAEKTTVIKVNIKPLEKAISNEVIE